MLSNPGDLNSLKVSKYFKVWSLGLTWSQICKKWAMKSIKIQYTLPAGGVSRAALSSPC
jgi:hypothetical protein